MTTVSVQERPDGTFRVRSADGSQLFETSSLADAKAFLAGYTQGMRKALAVMEQAQSDATDYLQGLQAEAAGVAWGK